MPDVESYFSSHYGEARAKFLEACARNGFEVTSRQNPARGPDGERLFMDVARRGPADAHSVLLVMSGTHGVEGYCGSGVQLASLHERLYAGASSKTAVVLIHAINPYGFAWDSRTNEDCVDICRNFVDFAAGPPVNAAYDELAPILVPQEWTGAARAQADELLTRYIEKRGAQAALADIATGQYEHWDAPFYGGETPVWSNRQFLAVVREHCSNARYISCVDFHSGLGPYGYGEMLVFHQPDSPGARSARSVWGSRAKIVKAGESSAYDLKGGILEGLELAVPHALLTAGALEFGTVPVREMVDALRADHWLRVFGEPGRLRFGEIGRKVRDAFYCDEPRWRQMVAAQGMEVQEQALRGLRELSA